MAAKVAKKVKKFAPPAAIAKALRTRKTSFGVRFERRKAITTIKNSDGERVKARNPGKDYVVSARRFCTESEAKRHGKRFMRIEGHKAFSVIALKQKPNAWVNPRTGKTNPVIGRARTNRR